ncbi:MAG: hypothetical protein AAF337_13855 [Pseudomonadota bacterium]
MNTTKRGALSLLLGGIAAASTSSAALANDVFFRRRRRGRSAITVSGGPFPRLNQATARALSRQLGRDFGPLDIRLDRLDIDPRIRSGRSRRVRQNLGRSGFRCGRETLVYERQRGRIEARYNLRYRVIGQGFRSRKLRARGRVSTPLLSARNGVVNSRCGTQRIGNRALRQFVGFDTRSAGQPLAALRDPLARSIAHDIAQDLRGRRFG